VATDSSRDVVVGKDPWDASFGGALDEVRLYDRALGTGEVLWAVGPRGTPQWWLEQYGLTNGTLGRREELDADADRMTGWEEWVAGTVPTNPDSLLTVDSAYPSSTATVVVTWQSASNRLYELEWSSNLWSGFTLRRADLLATPPLNTYTDTVEVLPDKAFYRVRARPSE
jgi:hypothetical protein